MSEDSVVTAAVAGNRLVEEGSNGKLIVRRAGDTSQAITVRYKIAGAAMAGVDYTKPGGTVVIPAGTAQETARGRTARAW